MPLSIYSSASFTKLNREGIKSLWHFFSIPEARRFGSKQSHLLVSRISLRLHLETIILTVLLKLNFSILNGVTPHTLPPLPMLLTWKKSFAICILRYLIFMIKESWPHKKPYQILGEISWGNAKRCWFTIYFKVQYFLLFQHCPAVSLVIN